MIDRPVCRAVLIAAVMGLAAALLPAFSFAAFPQSTETSGEIATDLNGTWLVVNRIEFPRQTATPGAAPTPAPSADAVSPAPAKPAPSPAAEGKRPFTVA
jgi:hypothetical protein